MGSDGEGVVLRELTEEFQRLSIGVFCHPRKPTKVGASYLIPRQHETRLVGLMGVWLLRVPRKMVIRRGVFITPPPPPPPVMSSV